METVEEYTLRRHKKCRTHTYETTCGYIIPDLESMKEFVASFDGYIKFRTDYIQSFPISISFFDDEDYGGIKTAKYTYISDYQNLLIEMKTIRNILPDEQVGWHRGLYDEHS